MKAMIQITDDENDTGIDNPKFNVIDADGVTHEMNAETAGVAFFAVPAGFEVVIQKAA